MEWFQYYAALRRTPRDVIDELERGPIYRTVRSEGRMYRIDIRASFLRSDATVEEIKEIREKCELDWRRLDISFSFKGSKND